MHHSFTVAGRQQRVVLPVEDKDQVPQVGAAPRRLEGGTQNPELASGTAGFTFTQVSDATN